ncbi:MAG: desulfoferrodoxin [Candidatus Zophobacter franzmannii]|jgi:superoxide reductase|nr:desulfoferrodoxin [Candidatus Zophobacter franzmannii]
MESKQIYYCAICGNVIEVLYPGAPALVCCKEPMQLLEEKSADFATEKHVPVVEAKDGGVMVTVGSTLHPMVEDHFIAFIEVVTKNLVLRAELKPGDAPQAFFPVAKEDVLYAREWCNKHGLWKG